MPLQIYDEVKLVSIKQKKIEERQRKLAAQGAELSKMQNQLDAQQRDIYSEAESEAEKENVAPQCRCCGARCRLGEHCPHCGLLAE